MKPPVQRKAPRKSAARKTSNAAATGGVPLADLIVAAPNLVDPDFAGSRVTQWLAGSGAEARRSLKALLSDRPLVRTLLESLAENSPYLWELASREPGRLLRLLRANPEQYLEALLSQHSRAAAASKDEAEAMVQLRRMKGDAALLIALADIGGIWPVMRTAQALTDLADTAVDSATRFALAAFIPFFDVQCLGHEPTSLRCKYPCGKSCRG